MLFSRRDTIRMAAACAPLFAAGRAFAAPSAGRTRLLLVFLRGGYDASNIIVPTGSDFYYQARPTIGLARPDSADPDAALALDADWSLHPALKESIYPLWQKKQVAFVPFAGTNDVSRSHFQTQDTIELGAAAGGRQGDGDNGFMARLAGVLGDDRPIAFTTDLPLCFRGGPVIPNIALKAVGKTGIGPRQAKLIQAMYKNEMVGSNDLGSAVSKGFQVRDAVFEAMLSEQLTANRSAIPARGFELSGRRVGYLMREQFNLAFVDVGGWDTHVNEGGAHGYLAGRIGELGRGLAGFVEEIGPDAWRDTLVVVVSEFGRTFRENGNRGTDHGHGSIYWVLGGHIAGGRIAGPQVTLLPSSLNQDRDLPVLTDYRSLLAEVVARRFGLGTKEVQAIFPDARPATLNVA
jgi:uncharacterized protein (DUF1501 family)